MTDSTLPTPDAAAGKRRRRLLLRKRLYQRFWGGRAANETPLVVFLAGTPDIARGYVVEALEANFDTDVYRAGDARVFDSHRLHSDDVLRQRIGRSRAPCIVFVAGGESDAIAPLIERFSPARVLWFYDDVDQFVARAPRALDEAQTRQFLAEWAQDTTVAPPDELQRIACDPALDPAVVWALAWYVIHAGFRRQRLDRRSAAHLICERTVTAAPADTMNGVFEIIGLAMSKNKHMPRLRARKRRARSPELPPVLRQACAELQTWLDGHAEDPAAQP